MSQPRPRHSAASPGKASNPTASGATTAPSEPASTDVSDIDALTVGLAAANLDDAPDETHDLGEGTSTSYQEGDGGETTSGDTTQTGAQFSSKFLLITNEIQNLDWDSTFDLLPYLQNAQTGVHLIGEAKSRSMTFAIAAIRGSFDNLYASNYEDQYCFNLGRDETLSDEIVQNVSLHADARFLDRFYEEKRNELVSHRVLYFQCPWMKGGHGTAHLIRAFINSASKAQVTGDLLVVGLCNDYPDGNPTHPVFSEHYHWEVVRQQAVDGGRYVFLGSDPDIIVTCGRYGYVHSDWAHQPSLDWKVKKYGLAWTFEKL
ncbi:hypothetical protein P7C70_g2712, partial [Phenoliferia sp. Uapishka_3]